MSEFKWEHYNLKRNKEAIKINKYNLKHKVNFLEPGVYKNIRDIYALSILISKGKKRKINILDYGGNLMSHVNLTNKISTKNIKFYIYNPFSKKNDQLKKKLNIFTITKISEASKIKIDLIYFGSVLQYIKNLFTLDKKILNKAKFILITHTPITLDKKSFFETQKNEKKLTQVVHTFNFLEKNILEKFKLIFKSINEFKYSGLKKKRKNVFSLNLLFKKK